MNWKIWVAAIAVVLAGAIVIAQETPSNPMASRTQPMAPMMKMGGKPGSMPMHGQIGSMMPMGNGMPMMEGMAQMMEQCRQMMGAPPAGSEPATK